MRGLCCLLVLAPALAWAGEGTESPCVAAAAQAETERNIPPGLLAAIGRIESGRWNPVSRRVEAWPWTVNAAGSGRYHPTLQDAVADVQREQGFGTRSVDVGCFQISLLHHPSAFASLEEAFDPLANARYAAGFLQTLWSNAGNWEVAVGQYHSATPGLGEPYRQQVMASWGNGGQGTPGPAVGAGPLVRVVSMTAAPSSPVPRLSDIPRPPPGGDPHVILVRATLNAMRIERGPAVADPHVIHVRAMLPRRGT